MACRDIDHAEHQRAKASRWRQNRENSVGAVATPLSDVPSPLVDIKLHQAFVPHLHQKGLARLLIWHVGALHHFEDFQRLFAKRAQDVLSIIQHFVLSLRAHTSLCHRN